MSKFFLFSIFSLVILSACNNPKTNSDKKALTDSTQRINKTLPENFYKRLEGSIGGKPIVMHLQKVNGDYDGDYYYNGSWLNLSTDTLIGKDSVVLSENSFHDYYFDRAAKQPRLALKWDGNGFIGTWENGDKTKKYPVSLKEKYPEGSYAFSLGIFQDSVKAYAGKPKSPSAQISFEYLKPTTKDDAGKWLDNQLKRISGIKPVTIDREIGFKNITEAYFTDYKNGIAEQKNNGRDDEFQAWMNYTNNSQQSINYNDKGFVVIDFLADAYTGGAHGNYSSTMFCLDVKNKKQLILSDLVTIDSNSLQKIVEKNFRNQYNLKPTEAINSVLFDNFLKPNKNFYFNNNGIAFMYNPYEVASYAQGQLVVFIPYSDLKNYLAPSFANRIGIKEANNINF